VLVASGGITPHFFTYFNSNISFRLHQEDRDEAKQANGDMVAELKAIWPGYFFSREQALLTKRLLDSTEKCGHMPWLEEGKAVNEFYQLLDAALKN